MLVRYKIPYMKKLPADHPASKGVRQDTRKHTKHCLRPDKEMVMKYVEDPTEKAWKVFEREYFGILESRFQEDRGLFDQLAALANKKDVFLGCSCPTKKNPDVNHCHTVLGLRFMKQKHPDLRVLFPS